MDQPTFEFVVYMIHACANRWHMTPKQVYAHLMDVNCINDYLVPFYDVLHTLGTNYLSDDIRQYLAIRGVTV